LRPSREYLADRAAAGGPASFRADGALLYPGPHYSSRGCEHWCARAPTQTYRMSVHVVVMDSDGGSSGLESEGERSESADEDEQWEASEIVSGLWVGRIEDAQLPAELAQRGIGLVVSVHDEEQQFPTAGEDAPKMEWYRIKSRDTADTDLLQHFDPVADTLAKFFAKRRDGRPAALVHCLAGQSRSAALVAAFLIRERGFTLRSLIKWNGVDHHQGDGLMQRARPGVFPNRGFWRQLLAYEQECHGRTSYTEAELPGSIFFDREKIEQAIRDFHSRNAVRNAVRLLPPAAACNGEQARGNGGCHVSAGCTDHEGREAKRSRTGTPGNEVDNELARQ
jgi:protein-tyrosine phosphatase